MAFAVSFSGLTIMFRDTVCKHRVTCIIALQHWVKFCFPENLQKVFQICWYARLKAARLVGLRFHVTILSFGFRAVPWSTTPSMSCRLVLDSAHVAHTCAHRLCLQVLGAKRKALSGFSTANAALHQGFIYASEVIEDCPEEFRKRAARLVGGKITLLARVDAYGSDPSGTQGATMKVLPHSFGVISRSCAAQAWEVKEKSAGPSPFCGIVAFWLSSHCYTRQYWSAVWWRGSSDMFVVIAVRGLSCRRICCTRLENGKNCHRAKPRTCCQCLIWSLRSVVAGRGIAGWKKSMA